MIFGCDYVKDEQSDIPLKGNEITSQYLEDHSSMMNKINKDKYKNLKVYSINEESPKAIKIEKRIISDLKSFSDKENSDANMSSIDDPEQFPDPNTGDAIIMVNSETGEEQLAIPLERVEWLNLENGL
jgi:hypothetical protein